MVARPLYYSCGACVTRTSTVVRTYHVRRTHIRSHHRVCVYLTSLHIPRAPSCRSLDVCVKRSPEFSRRINNAPSLRIDTFKHRTDIANQYYANGSQSVSVPHVYSGANSSVAHMYVNPINMCVRLRMRIRVYHTHRNARAMVCFRIRRWARAMLCSHRSWS